MPTVMADHVMFKWCQGLQKSCHQVCHNACSSISIVSGWVYSWCMGSWSVPQSTLLALSSQHILHHQTQAQPISLHWEVRCWSEGGLCCRQLLSGQPRKFKRTRQCIEVNMFLIKSLLMSLDGEGSAALGSGSVATDASTRRTSPADVEKVRSGHCQAGTDHP